MYIYLDWPAILLQVACFQLPPTYSVISTRYAGVSVYRRAYAMLDTHLSWFKAVRLRVIPDSLIYQGRRVLCLTAIARSGSGLPRFRLDAAFRPEWLFVPTLCSLGSSSLSVLSRLSACFVSSVCLVLSVCLSLSSLSVFLFTVVLAVSLFIVYPFDGPCLLWCSSCLCYVL